MEGTFSSISTDINSGASADVNAPALLFGLIDNVRVTNYSTVVSVSATAPAASEAGPTTGTFTLTRSAVGTPLTVNFTLTGTAGNGVDYTNALGAAVATSVTFAAADFTTNIAIIPVDDAVAELTETVVLTISSSPNYAIGSPSSDTVYIADNETPTIDLAPMYSTMYERLTNDYASFKLTRRGNLNAASFNVNFSASGPAGAYHPVGTLPFDPGVVSTNLHVHPIDNSTLDGLRSVTVTIASGGVSYNIGTNNPVTAAIVDDETPPETVLWSDNLQTDSSANWNLLFGAADPSTMDFTTNWMYDYSVDSIPAAPHSGTDTHGLKLDINATGAAAGVNLYPIGQNFSGNYALRFDMYLRVGPSTFTTELALFGLNHDGLHTNWYQNSGVPAGWTFDGLWYWIEADGARQYAGGDYRLNGAATGTAPTLLAGDYATNWVATFKSPPWGDYVNDPSVYGYAGVPGNTDGTATPCWADVELSQIGKVITLTLNRTRILSYTNTTYPSTGNIMLGYCDPANSIGPAASSILFANARVISLAAPVITHTVLNGGNAEITFTANAADVAGQFVLQQSTPLVTGPYSDTTSSINALGGGAFKAVKAAGAGPTFYRIRRIY